MNTENWHIVDHSGSDGASRYNSVAKVLQMVSVIGAATCSHLWFASYLQRERIKEKE